MALTASFFYNTETNQIFDSALKPVLTTDSFIEISREDFNNLTSEIFYSGGTLSLTFDAETSGLTLFTNSSATSLTGLARPLSGLEANVESEVQFFELIQDFIKKAPASYGYKSIENAVSYYNSGITAWRDEAIAFNTWRDNTESLMYDNIFSYTADGITLPNLAGFTAQAEYFDVGITSPSRPSLFGFVRLDNTHII